jgi:hypothetical protein
LYYSSEYYYQDGYDIKVEDEEGNLLSEQEYYVLINAENNYLNIVLAN